MADWDRRFMDLAHMVATWSKDPSSQVGAVAINSRNRAVISTGFNGFPRGVLDLPERYADRAEKYPRVVHAEANCIAHAASHGFSLEDATLYVTHAPCPDCAGLVINAGIKEVVHMPPTKEFLERWKDLIRISNEMFAEAGVKVRALDETPDRE